MAMKTECPRCHEAAFELNLEKGTGEDSTDRIYFECSSCGHVVEPKIVLEGS